MLLGQGLISKIVSFLSQIVMAKYLLNPDDFGVFSLGLSIFTFTSATLNVGTTEVLVHRQSSFHIWANASFWMTLASGLIAAAATFIAGPLAERAYEAAQLSEVLMILALSAIPTALALVPSAKLTADLRFTSLAATTGLQVILLAVLSIVFAAIHPGPEALAWAKAASATVFCFMLWWLAPTKLKWRAQFRRWKYLFADNTYLFMSKVALLVVSQGDYMILGLMTSEHNVGLYFFAFSLSMQSMALITGNVASVLFPALSKLQHDPRMQMKRFLRASELLAMIGVPACFVQAAVSRPAVELLFDERWHESIPLLQLLSLGMAFRMIGSPGGSLIMAQGRFRALLVLCLSYAVVFAAAVIVGGYIGDMLGVAIAATIFFTLQGPVNLYVAIQPNGGRPIDIWRVYAAPVTAGAIAVGGSAAIVDQLPLPPSRAGLIGQILLIGAFSGMSFLILARVVATEQLRELVERMSPFLGRRGAGLVRRVMLAQ